MKKSSFAGFLDGYKSSNIASVEGVAKNRIEEISIFLQSLAELQTVRNTDFEHIIKINIALLQQVNQTNIVDSLKSFGESFKSSIDIINNTAETVPASVEKIRKIIFDFGDIAKMIEDATLIDLAIYLASNFKY